MSKNRGLSLKINEDQKRLKATFRTDSGRLFGFMFGPIAFLFGRAEYPLHTKIRIGSNSDRVVLLEISSPEHSVTTEIYSSVRVSTSASSRPCLAG